MNTTAIDIYLYAPSANTPLLNRWLNVDYTAGSYNATLKPGWWNSTSSVSLEVTITPNGEPIFASGGAPGPLFTATYSGNSTDTTAVAGGVEQVNNFPTKKHGLSKGAVAAAVLIPLLFIIGLIVAAAVHG